MNSMKSRLAMLAAATLSSVVLLPVSAASAYTVSTPSECFYDDGGILFPTHQVCIQLTMHNQEDGTGIRLVGVDLYCYGNFESNPAVNGKEVYILNQYGDKTWSRGELSNIDGDCYRHYDTDVNMPGSSLIYGVYNFYPRYNNQPDPGYKNVVVQGLNRN